MLALHGMKVEVLAQGGYSALGTHYANEKTKTYTEAAAGGGYVWYDDQSDAVDAADAKLAALKADAKAAYTAVAGVATALVKNMVNPVDLVPKEYSASRDGSRTERRAKAGGGYEYRMKLTVDHKETFKKEGP